MLSAIFVDRPRLAIVIALVTTIAGLVSLLVIPIAQYPDIVPPQVQVTTTYPGANSSVVETSVAQAIEAQVVGVDKMIYMKSVSGDDGSYTLLCSFELGTDPDINTVNVNNRVQIALPSLPDGGEAAGHYGEKEIVGAAWRGRGLFAEGHLRPVVSFELCHDKPARPDQEHAGRRRRGAVGTAGLCDARLGQNRCADRPQPDHRRHHQRDPVAERAGRRRAHRRPADLERPAVAAQRPDKGAADLAGGIREDRDPHQPGRLGAASRRRRASGTRRRQSRSRDPVQQWSRSGYCDLPDTRSERDQDPPGGEGQTRATANAVSGRSGLEGHV